MISKYELVPNSEHYAITVDLLGRMGELNTALDVINNMPMQAGPDIWGASLSACRQHRNMKIVTQVLESKKRKGPELQASSQVVQSVLRPGSSICNVDAEYHQETLENLKTAIKSTKKLYAVMLDTVGAEMQVVNKKETAISLQADSQRHAEDVRQAREFLSTLGDLSQTQIFAKIENVEGLTHFDEILQEADGIILSRGNLGI
ncbi:hypothetical protein KIW84_062611 [Lathyrus oleraceus]|uniref:pyruvate kinase n=1 Tax=Pisum sativum TaxID=3888 RepID=A0A9D5A6M2_PEA|nr:hypothetical protein KIW84_062611 [Pisum sativum]